MLDGCGGIRDGHGFEECRDLALARRGVQKAKMEEGAELIVRSARCRISKITVQLMGFGAENIAGGLSVALRHWPRLG